MKNSRIGTLMAALTTLAGPELFLRSHGGLSRRLQDRSNYVPKPVERPALPPGAPTRQTKRAEAFKAAFASVNHNNPGMKRNERRKLAKAYAKGTWKAA